MPNAQSKGLMKVCSEGLAMWRRWRVIGLPRVYAGECVGSRSVDRRWKRWTDTMRMFKEKRFGCQARKENGTG